jgi:hypothetical protein
MTTAQDFIIPDYLDFDFEVYSCDNFEEAKEEFDYDGSYQFYEFVDFDDSDDDDHNYDEIAAQKKAQDDLNRKLRRFEAFPIQMKSFKDRIHQRSHLEDKTIKKLPIDESYWDFLCEDMRKVILDMADRMHHFDQFQMCLRELAYDDIDFIQDKDHTIIIRGTVKRYKIASDGTLRVSYYTEDDHNLIGKYISFPCDAILDEERLHRRFEF